MEVNSARTFSTAFFMRSSRSLKSWGSTAFRLPDKRADRLAPYDAFDVPAAHELEHDDGQSVVHTQRQRPIVQDRQPEFEHFQIVKCAEPDRRRIDLRIGA